MAKRRNIRARSMKKEPKQKATVIKKDKLLIKHITKQACILGAIIAGLYFAMSFLAKQQAQQETEQKKLEGEVRQLQGKTNSLNEQIQNLGAAAKIYTDLAASRPNMEFTVNPLAIRPILAELKDKYFITTLNLEISPAQSFPLKELQLNNLSPSRFDASINLASTSDHFIHQFLNEFNERMPGVVTVESLQMKRLQPMSIEVLSRLSRGDNVETMAAGVELKWYGFIEVKPESADKGARP